MFNGQWAGLPHSCWRGSWAGGAFRRAHPRGKKKKKLAAALLSEEPSPWTSSERTDSRASHAHPRSAKPQEKTHRAGLCLHLHAKPFASWHIKCEAEIGALMLNGQWAGLPHSCWRGSWAPWRVSSRPLAKRNFKTLVSPGRAAPKCLRRPGGGAHWCSWLQVKARARRGAKPQGSKAQEARSRSLSSSLL